MGISKIDGSLSREGIEESLQVKGLKIAPENLDTTFVKYVYETSQLSYLENVSFFNKTSALDATSNSVVSLLGPTGAGAEINTSQQNGRLDGLSIYITYDAAGLAAEIAAGIIHRWSFRLERPALTRYEICSGYFVPTLNYLEQVIISYHDLKSPILIPFSCELSFRVTRASGVWPANTSLEAQGSFLLRKRGLYL